jgi:hypothetical protein
MEQVLKCHLYYKKVDKINNKYLLFDRNGELILTVKFILLGNMLIITVINQLYYRNP